MSGTPRRYRLRLLLIALLALVVFAGSSGFFAYQVQQVPEFYQQAITAPPENQVEAAEQLEQQALDVQNQIQREEPWRVEFSADEINGWLATVLPEKFPKLLPPDVREPRVALHQDRLLAAGKVKVSGIETIVSIELSAYLTERPNEIAVRVHSASAGNVPVPLGSYLEQIAASAQRRGIFIRWQEVEGDPLGIVMLPLAEPGEKREIIVRSLELQPGKMLVSGTAEEPMLKEGPMTVEVTRQPAAESLPSDQR
jgi:hypothetical protein